MARFPRLLHSTSAWAIRGVGPQFTPSISACFASSAHTVTTGLFCHFVWYLGQRLPHQASVARAYKKPAKRGYASGAPVGAPATAIQWVQTRSVAIYYPSLTNG